MVVDIKRCIKEKIAIWCTTKEQSNQIWQDYHNYFDKKPSQKNWTVQDSNGFEIFFTYNDTPCWQDGYNKKYFTNKERLALICLDYKDVLLNKTYELW